MNRLLIVAFFLFLSYGSLAQEQQLIAASQADASAVFFDVADPSVPVIKPGAFKDAQECYLRDGLPSFFSKARSGQPLRIAYLGGSITRSNNMYRMQSAKFIQGMFPKVKMEGINAGVSGTDADLGACRLYEQVLKYNPDLLFIEFAVNGGFPQGVEGIIRQTKKYDPKIDICLIYTVTSKQLKEYENGGIPQGIRKLDSIAQHYSIPSIHMAREAAALGRAGALIEKGDSKMKGNQIVFSQDGVHPLEEGGNLYASAIARSMIKLKAVKSAGSYKMPEPLYHDHWGDAKMLDPQDVARFSSGWTRENPDEIGFSKYKDWFPYLMKAGRAGESFSFTFKGSMFGFFDIGGPEAGQLEMLVDGKSVKISKKGTNLFKITEGSGDKINRFNAFCNNRYRGQFVCVELAEGLHTVSFKISEEIPDKRKILGKNQLLDITANPAKYNRSVIYLGKILLRGTPVLSDASIDQSAGQNLSKERFKSPDNPSKPLTWWHWINGNVTKAGIKKDLLDMKRVGIGGVQLFDTHMYLPKGPVRYGSDLWHEHVQYAIKMCDSLGLEFYITNSPGWSGAGGPWITPEKSMKQLVYSETDVNGRYRGSLALHQPYTKYGFYKDIAVLAIPADHDGEKEIREKLVKISSQAGISSLRNLYDEDYHTGVRYVSEKKAYPSLDFEFKESVTLNSITIDLKAAEPGLSLGGTVEGSDDGEHFTELAKFDYSDHIAPSGNFTIPFSAARCKFLRLNFDQTKTGRGFIINEIKLRNLMHMDDWYARTGMLKAPFLTREALSEERRQGFSKEEIIDLTNDFDPVSGNLRKELPKGNWTILRFGYTTTGKKIHPAVDEGSGYEVDKLDPAAVTFQFDQSLGRIIRESGALKRKTFKGLLFDSFEGGFQNWTERMPEMFKAHNGYDIKSYLPVLAGRTVADGLVSSGFLWDFQQTLTTLFSENYYQTMQSLANSNNLQTFSETQGGPMSPAYGNKYVDVPMNEFWTDGIEKREELIKQTVSIANVLGKNMVAAESFTSKPEFGKWQNLPENLKVIGDYAFTTGINKFIFHTYTHQPFDVVPGFTMGRYGTHFGRTNTWWKYASGWMGYIGRSQYLLQRGRIVSDIAYLFPKDVVYNFPAGVPKAPEGFNYDIIYPQYLADIKVTNSEMILPSGARYKLMILPDYPYMPLETLRELEKLLQAGAILVGPPPVAPPDMTGIVKERTAFDQLVKQLWGGLNGTSVRERGYGKGKIYWGVEIDAVLSSNKIESDIDFGIKESDSLRYIHRKGDRFDVYFISNQSARQRPLNLSLRARGKQAEIWDAVTGEIRRLPVDSTDMRTGIPLVLDPKGSVFIVLSDNLSEATSIVSTNLKSSPKAQSEIAITSPWSLSFTDGRGAPENIMMPKLKLWNENEDPDIRYYSGTGVYKNTFSIKEIPSAGETVYLDLQELYDVAEVTINGKSAGIIWKKPYRLDITSYLKKGGNELQISVVNRWINRLIGDELIPVDLVYDHSGSIFTAGRLLKLPNWLTDKSGVRKDKRHTFTTWEHYTKDSPLVKSGLLGQVKLTIVK